MHAATVASETPRLLAISANGGPGGGPFCACAANGITKVVIAHAAIIDLIVRVRILSPFYTVPFVGTSIKRRHSEVPSLNLKTFQIYLRRAETPYIE
jgi:hypothetical protein